MSAIDHDALRMKLIRERLAEGKTALLEAMAMFAPRVAQMSTELSTLLYYRRIYGARPEAEDAIMHLSSRIQHEFRELFGREMFPPQEGHDEQS